MPPAKIDVELEQMLCPGCIRLLDNVMEGRYDTAVHPQPLQAFRQRTDHIGQSARLGQRGALGRGQQDPRRSGAVFTALLPHFVVHLPLLFFAGPFALFSGAEALAATGRNSKKTADSAGSITDADQGCSRKGCL